MICLAYLPALIHGNGCSMGLLQLVSTDSVYILCVVNALCDRGGRMRVRGDLSRV